jgi:hypothetical protein
MFDRVTALEIIDRAFNEQRLCQVCGAPTILLSDDDSVVLACSDTVESAGILTRISAFLMPHTRRVVLDLFEGIAA